MDTVAANGTTPTSSGNDEGPIERIVREIEEVLAPLDARREQLEAELLDIDEERDRLKAGIAGLTGMVSVPSEPKPVKKPKRPTTLAAGKRYASQKTLDDVYAVIARASKDGGDLSSAEIREGTGLSESVVHGAIRMLREDERIRITGSRKAENDGRGGGRAPATYAVMPSD